MKKLVIKGTKADAIKIADDLVERYGGDTTVDSLIKKFNEKELNLE